LSWVAVIGLFVTPEKQLGETLSPDLWLAGDWKITRGRTTWKDLDIFDLHLLVSPIPRRLPALLFELWKGVPASVSFLG
jgi:hypothetical protein